MKKFLFVLFLISIIKSNVSYSSEGNAYEFKWLDQDKEVYVLQNRKFRKKNSPYISVGGGKTVQGAFVDATTVQGRLGYFLFEDWGLELIYSKNSGKENETANSVKFSGSVPFYRKVENYKGGMIVWSPFYSKINTFNKIFYFDWIFGLGASSLEEVNNRNEFDTRTNKTTTTETHTPILWNVGLRLYFSEMFSFRIDFTGQNYKAGKASNKNEEIWYSNYDLTGALTLAF